MSCTASKVLSKSTVVNAEEKRSQIYHPTQTGKANNRFWAEAITRKIDIQTKTWVIKRLGKILATSKTLVLSKTFQNSKPPWSQPVPNIPVGRPLTSLKSRYAFFTFLHFYQWFVVQIFS